MQYDEQTYPIPESESNNDYYQRQLAELKQKRDRLLLEGKAMPFWDSPNFKLAPIAPPYPQSRRYCCPDFEPIAPEKEKLNEMAEMFVDNFLCDTSDDSRLKLFASQCQASQADINKAMLECCCETGAPPSNKPQRPAIVKQSLLDRVKAMFAKPADAEPDDDKIIDLRHN